MQSEMSKHFTVHFPRTDQSGIYQLMKVGLILWMHLLFDLAPFFEHNHNLRKLYIDARSLEDESAAKLVNILGESRNLRELVLCFNNNGKKWCIELGVLLLQNGLKLDMQQLIEVAIP